MDTDPNPFRNSPDEEDAPTEDEMPSDEADLSNADQAPDDAGSTAVNDDEVDVLDTAGDATDVIDDDEDVPL